MVNVELLKSEIKDLGVTQSTLAEKCHVSRQTISKWLANPRTMSIYHAKVLVDALRITDDDKILAIFFAPNDEKDSTYDQEDEH